ncbi:uncharacterized protein [Euphorbia lathyris]|uniref:uncharacterized protein n=1 Tax=Euphorbia lathyris TaxID=212925 RepID=UPI003313743C
MAIDVCSEISSSGISPRISFSYDLNQIREDSGRLDKSLLDSSDFDFCSFVHEQELSSADELFFNGKILPVQIKKPEPVSSPPTEKKLLKEFLLMSIDEDDDEDERASKSFWQFKRSNSLNCDSRSSRSRGLIRSLQFLSRSNSTPNPSKQPKNPHLQKQHSVPNTKSPAPFYPYNYYSGHHKSPAFRKCGSYGNTISPVLNISTGTVSLFGLGSLFCTTKVKPKKT